MLASSRALLFLSSLCLAASGCQSTAVQSADPLAQARKKLASSPRDPAVYLELAQLSLDRQDYLRAAQYLSLAEQSSLTAEQSERSFSLGLSIAVRSQHLSEAIRRLEERLQQRETLAVRRLLAALHEAHGDWPAAEREHLLIAELHSDATSELVETARFYERSARPDRLDRARDYYERYLSRAPQGAEAAQVRAALLINRHDANHF